MAEPRAGIKPFLGLFFQRLHQALLDLRQAVLLGNFVPETVANIKHVHRQLAIGGDDGRRNGQPGFKQSVRNIIEKPNAVEAFHLDDGGDGRRLIVEIDSRADFECCLAASRRTLGENGTRQNLSRQRLLNRLF